MANRLQQRLASLEQRAPKPNDGSRIVTIDIIGLLAAEAADLEAQARELAGPRGLVIVVDCPTCDPLPEREKRLYIEMFDGQKIPWRGLGTSQGEVVYTKDWQS